jgi:hypothetical protein
MPQWKMDLIFEARGRGWRETYYANFAADNFQGMLPFAQKLATARIAMSAAPVEIKAYSVSDPITSGKQGQTFYFRPRYKAPQWPDNDGATDPSTSVNVEFIRAANNATRQIQLRGCPDGIFDDFGELTGPLFGAWDQKYQAWRAVLLGQGAQPNANYGWFSRLPLNVPAGKVTYAYVPGAWVPTLTFPTDFFAEADLGQNRYVRIRGVNGGTSKLNGEQVLFITSRTTAETAKPLALGPMTTSGLAQRYAILPTFGLADNIGVKKAGRRAPGAPLLYTPGRRKGRART